MGTVFWTALAWGPLVVGLVALAVLVVSVVCDYTIWLRKQRRV